MSTVNFDSSAAQSYLEILQGVINRMAANSAGCKTWCITIVSAILVIVSGKANATYIWIALVPISLFTFLDSYYLGLEHRFIDKYNEFIEKLHNQTATVEDVYIVSPGGGFKVTAGSTIKAGASFSVWPFYVLLILMLEAVQKFIF